MHLIKYLLKTREPRNGPVPLLL